MHRMEQNGKHNIGEFSLAYNVLNLKMDLQRSLIVTIEVKDSSASYWEHLNADDYYIIYSFMMTLDVLIFLSVYRLSKVLHIFYQ